MIQKHIDNILGSVDIKFKKETFLKYEIEFHHKNILQYLKTITKENYNHLNNCLFSELGYKWDLIIDDLSYSISQEEFRNLTIDETDETDNILIRFNIYKSGKIIHIIDNILFNKYLDSTNLYILLKSICSFETEITLISEADDFELGLSKDTSSNYEISKQCSFRNMDTFPFIPETFHFENLDEKTKSTLDESILKLSLVFSLIFLFDSSEIKEDNLHLVISGNITYKYILPFKTLNLKDLKFYYQIYKWVYSEQAKIEDKLGLAKNILVSYLNDSSISISDSVFSSILSSNLIYVRGNISKYFEVRNKIIDQIEETINNINQSLNTFFSSFQKSIFVFISFFLTVFVSKAISKAEDDIIFTKETSILGIGFIILSVIFLVFSVIMLFIDRNRVKKRYFNVKRRFKDVLTEADIENILDGDFEYKNEILFFTKRTILYVLLWILTIILFTVLMFYSSDYLEFKKIIHLFNKEV